MTPEAFAAAVVGAAVVAFVGLLFRRLERRLDAVDAALSRLELLSHRLTEVERRAERADAVLDGLRLAHERNHGGRIGLQ
jgi:hypothetical protein